MYAISALRRVEGMMCRVTDTSTAYVLQGGIDNTNWTLISLQGATGAQGLTGIAVGATGLQGPTGAQGMTGLQGMTGIQGNTGSLGLTGFQGPTGYQGATGVQGVTGISNAIGITGTSLTSFGARFLGATTIGKGRIYDNGVDTISMGTVGPTYQFFLTGGTDSTAIINGKLGVNAPPLYPLDVLGAVRFSSSILTNMKSSGDQMVIADATGKLSAIALPSGFTGVQGYTGLQGITGLYIQGATGIQGITGFYIQGVTGIQGTGGTGTTNYVTKFTNGVAGIIGNSSIFDDGSFVGIGTTSPASNLDVNGTISISGVGKIRQNPTTGNLIISASSGGSSNATYFNYDSGTGGVKFCDGAAGIKATVDSAGNANFANVYGSGDIYTAQLTDFSASDNPQGFTSIATNLCAYKKIGKTVLLSFTIFGVSSASTFTFTLPYAANSLSNWFQPLVRMTNNSVSLSTAGSCYLNGSVCYVYVDCGGVNIFTASLNKGASGVITYETT
jgi:hypothetical protein